MKLHAKLDDEGFGSGELLAIEGEGDCNGATRETTPSFQHLALASSGSRGELDHESPKAMAGPASDRSTGSAVLLHTLNVEHDVDPSAGEVKIVTSSSTGDRELETTGRKANSKSGTLKELGLNDLDDLFDKIREGKDDGKPLRKGDPDAKTAPKKKGKKYEAESDGSSDASSQRGRGGRAGAGAGRSSNSLGLGLQMQLRPPRRRSSVETGAVQGAAATGILRKQMSLEESKMLDPEATKGAAAAEADAEESKKEAAAKAEKEAADRKKEEEERKSKKKKGKAEEGESRGPDVLDLLTRKYMLSFILIGGIFIANFLICYFILDAGKNFAFEINLAGRRRSIAREVAFYTRELYINDGIFLPRAEIFHRLVQKARAPMFTQLVALFKEIHQGLKSGDPAHNVYGADGRNKELDRIMYDAPQCLRLAADKCNRDRVHDIELVDNGLDALVMGVLDLVIAIMQETTPDLLLTGKEDESIVVHDNYFHINSNNLNLMMEIDDGDLDDGLNRAAAALVTEAINSMSIIELIEALILSFNIVFLGFLYSAFGRLY
eukprot:tig00000215_g18537.t1